MRENVIKVFIFSYIYLFRLFICLLQIIMHFLVGRSHEVLGKELVTTLYKEEVCVLSPSLILMPLCRYLKNY